MAITKTITIQDDWVDDLIEVYGQGWTSDWVNPNTGQAGTKAQFASQFFDRRIIYGIKQDVVSYRRRQAQEAVSDEFGVEVS